MTEFLTQSTAVVTSVAGNFATIGGDLIDCEVMQLVIGMAIFTYLFNKSIKLVKQIKRG